jgi:hypothetical protein
MAMLVFIIAIVGGLAYTAHRNSEANNNGNMTFKIGDFNMTRVAYLDVGENMIISANSLTFTDNTYNLVFDTALGTLDFNKTKAIIFEINGTKYKFVKENE